MPKVAVAQNSPVSRRLGMTEGILDRSTPFQKARSKFVIGSPVMRHSPRNSSFFLRYNASNPSLRSSTPNIEKEPPDNYIKQEQTSPVVRWVMKQPRPWSLSSSDEDLAMPCLDTSTCSTSSGVSEKCYSLTYQEESAATLELDEDDLVQEEDEASLTSFLVPCKEEIMDYEDSKEPNCWAVSLTHQGRFADETEQSTRPDWTLKLCDPTMVSTLKHMVFAVSGNQESAFPPLPPIINPREMIQFKVHAPCYADLTSVGGSSQLLAEMVARVTMQPHSHVKLTLPNGEKLQIISQDAWSNVEKKTHRLYGSKKRNNSKTATPKEDKGMTTDQQNCSQCHLLKEELQQQNDAFRKQITDTEHQLDAVRERLNADSTQMEALEATLKEERLDRSRLQDQFETITKKGRLPSTVPKERKRSCSNLQLIFEKNKVAKKPRPSLSPIAAINRLQAMKSMTVVRKSQQMTLEQMENHPDVTVRQLYQAYKKSDFEKDRLEESVRDLKLQMLNSKEQQQRALENELIQLREKNQLLTESYQAEKIARKRFFSMLEDAKGKIRVYCRVRPLLPNENSSVLDCIDDYTVALNGARGRHEFQFDHVFTSKHTQEDVFAIAKDMVNLAYDGYNVCIFGYGQTGSGKTYTLLGDPHGKNPGIASRAFIKLFELVEENEPTQETMISISAMELYNEKLLDLLHPQGVAEEKLEIRKEPNGMVSVIGCKSKRVTKTSSLLAIFYEACARRHVASTKMNNRSSRSHLIITLLVESINKLSGAVTRGKFSLVDLAGSERQSKSDTVSAQLKEANSINKSLSALGDVIAALASEQPHVPYRNNKLTQLMQDSLGGNAKTLMFVNVSPAEFNLEETTSSLHYAARVKQIKNDPSRMTETKEIARLKAIISRLRKGENVNEA